MDRRGSQADGGYDESKRKLQNCIWHTVLRCSIVVTVIDPTFDRNYNPDPVYFSFYTLKIIENQWYNNPRNQR